VTRTRATLLAAVLVAVVGLALWATTGILPRAPSQESRATPADAGEHATERLHDSGTLAGAGDGATPRAAGRADETDPDDTQGFPTLDVRLVGVEGAPAYAASVDYLYALPAGGKANLWLGDGPHTALSGATSGRLVFPAAGRYDVGVLCGRFATLVATDVDVPRDGPLTVSYPRFEPLTIDVDPALASTDFSLSARTGQALPRGLPGRGEALPLEFRRQEISDVRLPAGLAYEVSVESKADVVWEPGRVTVPGRVRISRDSGIPLQVEARLVPADRRFDRLVLLQVDFECGRATASTDGTTLEIGRPLSTLRLRTRLRAPAERGLLTWSGAGIVPGQLPYVLEAGRQQPLRVDVEVDSPPTPQAVPSRESDVRIVDGVGLPASTKMVLATDREVSQVIREEPEFLESVCLDRDPKWLVLGTGRSVAGPVRISGESLPTLRLRLGGLLEVAYERPPPTGLGELRLRRRDGAPLLWRSALEDEQESPSADPSVPANSMSTLGPLEPGPLDLVASAGGVDLASLSVTVRANEVVTLTIPALHPPPPR
jgi:hypothetical protein